MMSAKGEAEARSGSRRHCFIVGAHFPTNRQIEHLANGAADPICPNEFLDWARTRYESAVNVASLAYLVHRRRSASLMAEMGHSRRDWLRATIGPRPLRPESDHSRHESEMARWANSELMHRSKQHSHSIPDGWR